MYLKSMNQESVDVDFTIEVVDHLDENKSRVECDHFGYVVVHS